MLKLLVAAAGVFATFNASFACTAVNLVAADGTVIAGRTMEWAFDMKWTLVSRPKGTQVELSAPPSLRLPTKTIATKFAVVGVTTATVPGDGLLDGQNSAGLSMSSNFLPGFTEYQTVVPQDRNYVSILGFGMWSLGQFATVADLRRALPDIKVWDDNSLQTGPITPTNHFVFTDRSGASIVVEYVKGQLHIYDNVAGVLTNAPTYDWQLTNLRNYLNLSTVAPLPVHIGTTNVTALGQGGGLVGIPGDYTPPSRFVRAAFLRNHATQPKGSDDAIQLMGHILNTVDIPLGVAQSREGSAIVSDYTQFVVIKDLTHDRLVISDYDHRTTYLTLDLKKIFASEKPSSNLISTLPYPQVVDSVEALIK